MFKNIIALIRFCLQFIYSFYIAGNALHHGACQKQIELAFLIRNIRRLNLMSVAEIGTADGGTLYVWEHVANTHATIISIDLHITQKARCVSQRKRKNQNVVLLEKNSHDVKTKKYLQKILKYGQIDLLFIDGDHTYAGVKKDWQMYSPMVRKGGIVIFHDIVFHPQVPNCRIDDFWHEIKKHYKHREICMEWNNDKGWGQWGGIGILYI